ncbi:MAG: Sjogren's syndrome/scleroderma autoantigen 1 family protein, partial [Candidatus Geothermarchaeales archaeon]
MEGWFEVEEEAMKRAAGHIRGGAKLTSKPCPLCEFLLLEKEGKYYCPKCDKEMILFKTDEEYARLSSELVLNQLKELIVRRIDRLRTEIEGSPENQSLL